MKKNILFIHFLLLFGLALSGCSTNRYVSEQYPKGNDNLSKADYNECLKEVPYQTIQEANNINYKHSQIYIAGIKGQPGYFLPVTTPVCLTACQSARSSRDMIVSDCMLKKGWTLKKGE